MLILQTSMDLQFLQVVILGLARRLNNLRILQTSMDLQFFLFNKHVSAESTEKAKKIIIVCSKFELIHGMECPYGFLSILSGSIPWSHKNMKINNTKQSTMDTSPVDSKHIPKQRFE